MTDERFMLYISITTYNFQCCSGRTRIQNNDMNALYATQMLDILYMLSLKYTITWLSRNYYSVILGLLSRVHFCAYFYSEYLLIIYTEPKL